MPNTGSVLLHGYLPAVSDQVLLFATDAEADAPFLDEAQPYLAYAYRLRFDPVRGDTEATPIEPRSASRLEYLSLQDLPHAFSRLYVSEDIDNKLRVLKMRTGLTPNLICRMGLLPVAV